MIVNETGVNAFHFVGAYRRANTAAADCDAAIHLACDHCLAKRYNVVRVIVARVQAVSAEIDHLVPRFADLGNQPFLQSKSTVICGDAHFHATTFSEFPPAAAWSASTNACSRRIRPPGMEVSPFSSWSRDLTFSLPVTTQRIRRARLMTGYVSVIRFRPW